MALAMRNKRLLQVLCARREIVMIVFRSINEDFNVFEKISGAFSFGSIFFFALWLVIV